MLKKTIILLAVAIFTLSANGCTAIGASVGAAKGAKGDLDFPVNVSNAFLKDDGPVFSSRQKPWCTIPAVCAIPGAASGAVEGAVYDAFGIIAAPLFIIDRLIGK